MEQVPLQCEVCSQRFSGPVPAQQHFISQKHLKKVANSAHLVSSNTYCRVCNVHCDTLTILRAHEASPRHCSMVEKQNHLSYMATLTSPAGSESSGQGQMIGGRSHGACGSGRIGDGWSKVPDGRGNGFGAHGGNEDKDYVFDGNRGYCYLCSIELTSSSHATSHINGKNHEKKKNRKMLENGAGDSDESFSGSRESLEFSGMNREQFCSLCQVTLTGSIPARQHYDGEQHKKKVRSLQIAMEEDTEGAKVIKVTNTSPIVSNGMQRTEDIPNNMHANKCEVCQVFISGPDSARQHYASDKHKKKLMASEGSSEKLECTICNVYFSCADNKRDHMASSKHKKAVDLIQKEQSGELLPLFCKVCNCGFTGQESAQDHYNSKKHKKHHDNWEIQHRSRFTINPANAPYGGPHNVQPIPDHRSSTGGNQTGNVDQGEIFGMPETVNINTDSRPETVHGQYHDKFGFVQESNDNLGVKSPVEDSPSDDDSFLAKPLSTDIDTRRERENVEEGFIPKPISMDRDDRLLGQTLPHHNDANENRTTGIGIAERLQKQFTALNINQSSYATPDTADNRYESNSSNPCPQDVEKESLTELKIKRETHGTSGQSLSEILMSDVSYQSNWNTLSDAGTVHDDQPPQFIRNNLQQPGLGRGRGIFKMCNLMTGQTPGLSTLTKDGHREDAARQAAREQDKPDPNIFQCDDVDDETKLKGFMSKIKKPDRDNKEEDSNDERPEVVAQQPYDTIQVLQYAAKGEMVDHEKPNFSPNREIQQQLGSCSGDIGYVVSSQGNRNDKMAINNSTGDLMLQHNQYSYPEMGWISPFRDHQRRMSMDSDISGTMSEGSTKGANSEGSTGSGSLPEYKFSKAAERGWCNVCSIELTSTNHMRQHVYGKKHMKACQMWKGGIPHSMLQSSYRCDVCCVSFSGPESQKQHYESVKHQNKVRQYENKGQEFFCDVCQIACSGEVSYMQHLSGAQHLKMSGGRAREVTGIDATIWYDCKVCKCRLNTLRQLQIHETSPSHLAKAQKLQGIGTGIDDELCEGVSAMPQQFARGDSGEPSLLDKFLSEPLFPDEFISDDSGEFKSGKQGAEPKPLIKPEVTDGPIPVMKRYAMPQPTPSQQEHLEDDGNGNGAGNAKRGQGSELAWATRSRGSSDTPNKNIKMEGCPSSLPPGSAVRPDMPLENVKPYAATHRYYCKTCKVPMNTQESLEAHIKGKRHMAKVCNEKAPDRQYFGRLNQGNDDIPKTKSEPRNYQVELFKRAVELDTLCFLPTGTGKTLVSVLTLCHMLKVFPSKNVLFLVDKVLLVLQQSKYIREQIGEQLFVRYDPDSGNQGRLVQRPLNIAGVCMGQQGTRGVPMWKHDVVIVTAAFCENMLNEGILKWTDFSLVIFDEAHHCKMAHPFNKLLQHHHSQVRSPGDAPKILGLTASPAGKSDVPKTVMMLEELLANLGGAYMNFVVEKDNVRTLHAIQSNAEMVIKVQSDDSVPDQQENNLIRRYLLMYIIDCIKLLSQVSNVKSYLNLDWITGDSQKIPFTEFEINIDPVQSCLGLIYSDYMEKVQFSLFTQHIQSICMAYNSLLEGGILCTLEEISEMEATDANFKFARGIGLPCDNLYMAVLNQGQHMLTSSSTGSDMSLKSGTQIQSLIHELVIASDGNHTGKGKSISLVLVKQRSTAHKLCKVLNSCHEMQKRGLRTATVVGHGGSGATDKGMSVNQQKRVLEEIKQQMYQVVIATSVAEEGVDWPECDRVISMYPPSTVTALVQMRGRARKKDSKFIILCNNEMEREKLTDIMRREKNMMEATKIIIERQNLS